MKLLVVFAVMGLAAALPVADPHAAPEADPEADPALVYTTGVHTLPYTSAYISPYTSYSGYPNVYSTGYRYGYSNAAFPSYNTYTYGRKKRSAAPEPRPDAEADPALVYSSTGLNYPYVGSFPYTYNALPTTYRYPATYSTLPLTYSARPTTYSYTSYPATSYTAVVQGRKKRSADPEPQPEADPEADPQLLYTAQYNALPAVTTRYAGTYSLPYSTYPYTTYPLTYNYPRTYIYGK